MGSRLVAIAVPPDITQLSSSFVGSFATISINISCGSVAAETGSCWDEQTFVKCVFLPVSTRRRCHHVLPVWKLSDLHQQAGVWSRLFSSHELKHISCFIRLIYILDGMLKLTREPVSATTLWHLRRSQKCSDFISEEKNFSFSQIFVFKNHETSRNVCACSNMSYWDNVEDSI